MKAANYLFVFVAVIFLSCVFSQNPPINGTVNVCALPQVNSQYSYRFTNPSFTFAGTFDFSQCRAGAIITLQTSVYGPGGPGGLGPNAGGGGGAGAVITFQNFTNGQNTDYVVKVGLQASNDSSVTYTRNGATQIITAAHGASGQSGLGGDGGSATYVERSASGANSFAQTISGGIGGNTSRNYQGDSAEKATMYMNPQVSANSVQLIGGGGGGVMGAIGGGTFRSIGGVNSGGGAFYGVDGGANGVSSGTASGTAGGGPGAGAGNANGSNGQITLTFSFPPNVRVVGRRLI